jgi:hypothetical protein
MLSDCAVDVMPIHDVNRDHLFIRQCHMTHMAAQPFMFMGMLQPKIVRTRMKKSQSDTQRHKQAAVLCTRSCSS